MTQTLAPFDRGTGKILRSCSRPKNWEEVANHFAVMVAIRANAVGVYHHGGWAAGATKLTRISMQSAGLKQSQLQRGYGVLRTYAHC